MATTFTRVFQVFRTGSTDYTIPPAGLVPSTTVNKADFVTLNGSGQVAQATAVGTTIGNSVRIALANESATSAASGTTLLGVEKIDEDTEMELPIATSVGNPANQPTTSGVALSAIIGQQYGITRSPTGNPGNGAYYVDTSVVAAASVKVEVTRVGPSSPVGDAFPTVICKLLYSSRIS